jgi:DNA-directed RNA polymerase alpha subunit
MEIWTNGSVEPLDALSFAAKIIKEERRLNFFLRGRDAIQRSVR